MVYLDAIAPYIGKKERLMVIDIDVSRENIIKEIQNELSLTRFILYIMVIK